MFEWGGSFFLKRHTVLSIRLVEGGSMRHKIYLGCGWLSILSRGLQEGIKSKWFGGGHSKQTRISRFYQTNQAVTQSCWERQSPFLRLETNHILKSGHEWTPNLMMDLQKANCKLWVFDKGQRDLSCGSYEKKAKTSLRLCQKSKFPNQKPIISGCSRHSQTAGLWLLDS